MRAMRRAGSYSQGQGGALSIDLSERISGGGLQMKAGIQWAPIEAPRIAWMVATPSYLAVAVAFRYAHGSGTLAGVTFPSAYPSAGTQPTEVNLVEVTVNELSANVAFKAAF